MKNRILSICLTLLFAAQLLGAEPRATSSGSRIAAVAEKDQRQTEFDPELQKALDVLRGKREDKESDSTWSLAEIQDMGLRQNPTLIAAAARLEQVRATWVRHELSSKSLTARSDEDSQPASHSLVAIARQDIRRAEHQSKAQILRVKNDIRICYFNLLVTQAVEPLADSLVRVNQDIVTHFERQVENHKASSIDLLKVRRDAHTATILSKQVRHHKTASWRRLGALIGTPEITPKPLVGDLAAIVSREIDEQVLLPNILTNSPQVIAAKAGAISARLHLDRLRASSTVDDGSDPQPQDQTPTTQPPRLLPIPTGPFTHAAIQAAEIELVLAERELATVKLSLRARYADAFARYSTAGATIDEHASKTLPAAKTTWDSLLNADQQDKAHSLQALIAEKIYCELSLEYLEALRDLSQAAVELDGFLLTNCLDQPIRSRSR